MQLYCVRCKKQVEVAKVVGGLASNGRSTASGPCPKCNTACNRFVKASTVAGVPAPKRRSSRKAAKRKSGKRKS
jgi:hypothetical protein